VERWKFNNHYDRDDDSFLDVQAYDVVSCSPLFALSTWPDVCSGPALPAFASMARLARTCPCRSKTLSGGGT
jgi:hypothetical protein